MTEDSVPTESKIFSKMTLDLSNFVHDTAENSPFAIAVITQRQIYSFASLDILVRKAVTRLEQTGLEPGKIAGFRFRNQFLHLVFVLAALRSGIAHLSVFREWPDKLSNDFLNKTGAKIVFGEDTWPGSETQTYTIDLPSLARCPDPDGFSFREARRDVPALYVLGSGTTGIPRIIHYDAANLTAMVERDLKVRPIGFQERYFSMIAFDFFTSKRRALGCLAAGGTVIFLNQSAAVLAMCDYLGIDHLALVGNHAEFLAGNVKNNRPRLPRLKSLVIGGSPISEDLRERLRNGFSPNLFIGYGTNEFGEATFASAKVQAAHPGTVGMPAPGVDIKIVGPGGETLLPGLTGEILLRAHGMFSGYLNEAEATAKAFQDGWYRPGDLGSLTPEGALIYQGRSDDLMMTDGINIYPREIENVLESHPGVKDAAAFPLRSATHWQIPVAAVTLSDTSLSEAELRRHCYESIGPKLPHRILIVDKMPRNAVGKILKGDLLKLAEKVKP
jgi:acyl-coenzyme A synthetase/AMP-(fatty) acid ligase